MMTGSDYIKPSEREREYNRGGTFESWYSRPQLLASHAVADDIAQEGYHLLQCMMDVPPDTDANGWVEFTMTGNWLDEVKAFFARYDATMGASDE